MPYLSKIAATPPSSYVALRSWFLQFPAHVVVADKIGGELTAFLGDPQFERFVYLHDGNVVGRPFDAVLEVELVVWKKIQS